MLLSKLVTDNSVSVLLVGHPPLSATSSHPNFTKIVDALDSGNYDELPNLFNPAKAVREYAPGLEVVGNSVRLDGVTLGGPIVTRILSAIGAGRSPDWLVNFQRSLALNPSRRVRDRLYAFLEAGQKIGINDFGHIVAYKIVKALPGQGDEPTQFVSHHDGKTRHDIGQVVSMPRSEVDDDPERTCSYGLHACSEGYLNAYGGGSDSWVVAVEIKPENVVSIPVDYNDSKMRCSEYKVIARIGKRDEIARADAAPDLDDYSEEADYFDYDEDDGYAN